MSTYCQLGRVGYHNCGHSNTGVIVLIFFLMLSFSIADPQDEQNGQKTLAEDGLVFRSPEMKRSLQRPNKKKKMSKKSKHNRPQDRAPSHPKSNSSSTDDSDNSDSFYETLRRHQGNSPGTMREQRSKTNETIMGI